MFYLDFALKKILKNPFRALSFISLSILLTSVSAYYNLIQEKVSLFTKIQTMGPSFHALVNSKENAHWIARKINEIPGVTNVNVIEKEKIASDARKQLLGIVKDNLTVNESAHDDVTENILNSSFYGIKVVCDKGTSDRAISLLKEYMTRLAGGPENIIFGKITEFNQQVKMQGELTLFMKKELIPIALFVIFLFWIISFFIFEGKLREASYLIEKFQRRRQVAFKTLMVYLLVTVFLSIIPLFIIANYAITNFILAIVMMLIISALDLRKNRWIK